MANITVQGFGKNKDPRQSGLAFSTATTATTLDRTLRVAVDGVMRDFERVGVDASGNAIYRDQNRRPVR